MGYESVIGLEIHVQLKTKSKLFCSCDNRSEEAAPNTNICPICLGHPGTLPVLNRQALEYALRAALTLNCEILEKAKFDRKNYFYPDLPKGYQISMYDEPICTNGNLTIDIPLAKNGARKQANIRITRIHMEEDAAKMTHAVGHPEEPQGDEGTRAIKHDVLRSANAALRSTRPVSRVDFNRAGTPLIEIVSEPDLRTPLEAKIFLQELRRIARYLNISDADMEKGHLRADANISLRPTHNSPPLNLRGGAGGLYPKTELKNINSFRAVERALLYEIERQTKLWDEGNPPKESTTRGWDDLKGTTFDQRSKEGSADYRYFPEPDLPPLLLTEIATAVRTNMPELPRAKRLRLRNEYGFSAQEAMILTEEKSLADYVEKVIMELREWVHDTEEDGTEEEKWERNRKKLMKLFTGWFTSKLFGLMEKHAVDIRILKITPENFAELLTMLHQNHVNSTAGLQILEEMLLTGGDPSQIMEEKKLEQVTDEEEIATVAQDVIANNSQPVADFKSGKANALQFLVGQVMKASRGKANPDLAQKLLKKLLSKM